MLSKTHRFFISSLAFIIPGLAYWLTLAPDITWANQGADGGDLITAAYTLGVPHPSGYPTYVLTGWLFSKLPIGPIAWRFNLLSAISVAGAAWLIFHIVTICSGSPISALVSAWSFAFTPLVWSQAIITEVYGVNLFFIALLIWLGLRIRAGQAGASFFLGLTFGLALGVHLTVILLTPLLFWLVYRHRRAIWFKTLGGLSIGLAVFSYLPLRAGQGAITWGTPNTIVGFLALVSGQIYRGYLFDLPTNAIIPRILALIGYLSDMGVFALMLLALGIRWAWYQAKHPLYWTIASAGCYIIYTVGYRTADSYVYLLPIFVLAAIGIGLGGPQVISNFSSPGWQMTAKVVMLSLPLVLAGLDGQDLSLRDDHVASKFWQIIFSQAPPGAVLLTYQDNHTFTLWHAQHVLKQRPDVAIVDTGLLAYAWYRQGLKRTYPWLRAQDNLADLFQQQMAYSQPLCAVLGTEQVDQWSLDCLTPSTE